LAAQLLHRPRRRSAHDLVQHLTGVQAQVLPSAALALRARSEGLRATGVDRARLRERSIVLTWAMRGTLHLIAAEDHRWVVPLVTEPRLANAWRRLREEGVPGDRPAHAVRAIERMLDREGPLARTEIADRLRRRGIRAEGQAIAHLVWLAASEGVICYGPERGGAQTLVLVRDWLGRSERMERDAALTELAVRHLRAHGPCEPADLAFWSGIRARDATRAWGAITDRLLEVQTTLGPRWILRSRARSEPTGVVRLLPSFDEYLLGWKDRRFQVDPERWRDVNRGGGWLHPVAIDDGLLVGTWRTERTSHARRVELHPFDRLSRTGRRTIQAEADDLERFLGEQIELDVHPPGAISRRVRP
jgi:hypothetical protein